MNLRKKLENSEIAVSAVSGLLSLYLRFCFATTRWDIRGGEGFRIATTKGPVILVLWHSTALMAPAHVEKQKVSLVTLRDPSPAGAMSAGVQRRFGMSPVSMSAKVMNRTASRKILRHMRDGGSMGLTADGPVGPARKLQPAPLDWARRTGAKVYTFGFSTARHKALNTWDKMMLPLPFTKGAAVFHEWDYTLEKSPDDIQLQIDTAALETALNTAQSTADDIASKK